MGSPLTTYTRSVLYTERKKDPYIVHWPLDRFLGVPPDMARIPTEELERLKTEISVERLVEAAGGGRGSRGSGGVPDCAERPGIGPRAARAARVAGRECRHTR